MSHLMHGGAPRARHKTNGATTTYRDPENMVGVAIDWEQATNIFAEAVVTAGASAVAAKVLKDSNG